MSIFTDTGLAQFTGRIQRLSPASQAEWGKMNVAQMLAHSRFALEVPLGLHTLKPMFIMKVIGGMIRKKVLSDKPLSRNSPTAPTFVVADQRDFEKEKEALIKTLNAFAEQGRKGALPPRHPYFGKMSTTDWDLFQQRHLGHHLTQFGV